ncbi:uncharacterized protein LOC108629625 [Ceratina calcarata]|uniref:Uncharacterized protein LOC108629625 n=1 Tax=Ceratina calcarata TaxID=156304 RepID=A0AAJ7NCN4_9HYME|nr:uncharacterized protein LOC108629625 [Ceratina calcarata]
MVKFLRQAPLVGVLRPIYDKPLGYKIKVLWKEFKRVNPSLAFFGPPGYLSGLVLAVLTTYLALNENPVKKYYDHIRIFRADDPRVKTIRTDDSIGMTFLNVNNAMLPQDY